MKLSFHSKRFAQFTLSLAALTFTQTGRLAAETPAGAPIATVGEGASTSFRAVASHLELGARSFQYSEAGGLKIVANFLDEILKALPERDRKDFPPGFTITKLLQILGLDSIAATGSSTRARSDGSFHSRTFVHMPEGRKGLMTLSGGPAAKLMLLDLAPKDTDLAVEFPIHPGDFARESLPGIIAMIPPADRAKFVHEMSSPLPPLGLSGMEIIEKFDARVGIFLRLDPSQKFKPAPDAPEFPGADGVIVIERLGWLIEALKPRFMPLLSQPDAPITVTDEDGVLTVRFKGPAGPPPMDYTPVARFDAKADRLIIASRTAIFDSVVGGTEKITQGADFTQAWRDFPAEGNACLYVSPRLLQTAGNLIATAVQQERGSAADKAIFGKISELVKPLLSRGQAVLIANQPDGILALTNASIPAAGTAFTAAAVLTSLSVPFYTFRGMKAEVRALEERAADVAPPELPNTAPEKK